MYQLCFYLHIALLTSTQHLKAGISNLASKFGHIGPNGTDLGLFKVHYFCLPSQNVLKLIFKSPKICPIWGQFGWQIWHPGFLCVLLRMYLHKVSLRLIDQYKRRMQSKEATATTTASYSIKYMRSGGRYSKQIPLSVGHVSVSKQVWHKTWSEL